MKIVYRRLFTIRLRHTFYQDGESSEDFRLVPTPTTASLLEAYGLVFRGAPSGGTLFAKVTPDSDPATLLSPHDPAALRFQFLMLPRHRHVTNITDGTFGKPGRSLLYFDNLREDIQDGRLHLGDSVAGARVGTSIDLVTGSTLSFSFASPVSKGTLTLEDRFGTTVHNTSFDLGGETTSELRLDLGALDGLEPGRYRAFDGTGGELHFFYGPDLFAQRPFGVVEVFNTTTSLAAGGAELVPASYRFLSGTELTGVADYHVQLQARSTTWRYNVVEKYGTGSIQLAQVNIVDPLGVITFSKTLEASRAVFSSTSQIALSEAPPGLELHHGADTLSTLSYPRRTTPLQVGAVAGQHVSEMFVYV